MQGKTEQPKRRNPYADLGLTVAISVFICVLVNCLLFGFTVISIIWLLLAIGYFYISWKFPSSCKLIKYATTAFLSLSVVAIVGLLLFDTNARPKMNAFEGSINDTIQDEKVKIVETPIQVYELPQDSVSDDSVAAAEDAAVLDDEFSEAEQHSSEKISSEDSLQRMQ